MSVVFRSLILGIALISDPQSLSIKVVPRVVMAGSAIRVTCVVPRNAENRWLEVAISNYIVEGRQLDGENARVTNEFIFDHVPCAAESAACAIRDQHGKTTQVDRRITVAGCDGE